MFPVLLTGLSGWLMSRTRESTDYAKSILLALNLLDKPMYEGTVPAHVKAQRRAKNKVARKSRRVNRAH